jgi:uncharacterized membrane protein
MKAMILICALHLLIALGTLEGLIVYKIVMPLFAGGMVHHDTRIAPLSGIIGKSLLIIKALASFGLLPLFYRWGVIYALPGFILVLMGGDLVMQSFDYHYHDLGFALLACSSILGLRSLAQLGDRDPVLVRRIFNVIVLLLLTHAIRFPTFYIRRQWPSPEMLAMHRDIPAIKRYIDEHKPNEVWTLDHLGPYFHEQLNLKSILKPELPASAGPKVRRLIIISPHVKTYPLRQLEYRSLQRYLGTHYSEVTESAGVSSGLQIFISGT